MDDEQLRRRVVAATIGAWEALAYQHPDRYRELHDRLGAVETLAGVLSILEAIDAPRCVADWTTEACFETVTLALMFAAEPLDLREFLTPHAVAAREGVTVDTAWRWFRSPTLRSVWRAGGQMVHVAELEHFLARRRRARPRQVTAPADLVVN